MPGHDANCKHPDGWPCRSFSTDGTLLGAHIAHTMGTTSEAAIIAMGFSDYRNGPRLTGMAEEQADWEADEADAD